jgi:ABC-type sugar transport system permease subunit
MNRNRHWENRCTKGKPGHEANPCRCTRCRWLSVVETALQVVIIILKVWLRLPFLMVILLAAGLLLVVTALCH